MRPSFLALPVLALALGAACSDSDSGGPDESAGGSAEEFCGDFQDLEERYAEDVDADPEVVLDELDALEPPDDIADDYQQLIDALRETNTLDPASEEDVARAQEIAEETQEANENVSTFLAEECEIDTSAGP
ncbi:MAG TPA: hypothetical protein VKZ72_01575 [Acidimicrobiales bacterium]|jgi:hypothetical protein|nr:hypothetical protein [Acidimicrobiales bacterium]